MSFTDDDYYSNTFTGPIKKNYKGVSYKGMFYYTGNSNSCILSGSNKSDYNNEHPSENDKYTIWGNEFPNSVNKYGTKVLFTRKRIKHRYSHNHCSAFHCGCKYRDKKKKIQKDENKEFQSNVKDALYEDDSD